MLWDDMARNTSPALDTGGRDWPTTFGETLGAAWSRNTLFSQDYFGENDRMAALNDYLAKVKTMTGEDIGAQLDYRMPEGAAPAAQDLLRQANDKVNELKKKNPALELEPMTPDELSQNAVAKRRKSDADFEETIDRPRGPGATVGRWLGAGAAGAADPINLAALPIAPEAELGILGSALRWSAIAGGAGAVGTTLAAPYREQVQPGYIASGAPLAEIAEQAAMGAAGGALFPAARAIARPTATALANAWDRVRSTAWPTSVKDAGNIVSSAANITQSNIYPGVAGGAAHEQALAKTTNDILARRPVDVSDHITPELEAGARSPDVETTRLQAQAAAANAVRPVPVEERPELPFEQTAAETAAEARKQDLILDVYDAAREGGYDDIPMAEAGQIADKLIDATPEEAEKILRDLKMSPRQVADAPARIEPPAEPVPTPVAPVADIHAPDFQTAVRADLDRELAALPPPGAVPTAPRTLAEIDAGHAPASLPEDHANYFKLDANTQIVPIADLISSKTPEENAKGATNGAKRMAASARGELGKRAPITVRPLENGKFLVLDGNGTMTAASNYGWKNLPVKLESQPISEMGIPTLAASRAEAGREAPGIISAGVMEPGAAAVQPAPFVQTSMRPEPLGSLINRATVPSTTTGPTRTFAELDLGSIDSASNKHILQGSNDFNALRERMEQNKPL